LPAADFESTVSTIPPPGHRFSFSKAGAKLHTFCDMAKNFFFNRKKTLIFALVFK